MQRPPRPAFGIDEVHAVNQRHRVSANLNLGASPKKPLPAGFHRPTQHPSGCASRSAEAPGRECRISPIAPSLTMRTRKDRCWLSAHNLQFSHEGRLRLSDRRHLCGINRLHRREVSPNALVFENANLMHKPNDYAPTIDLTFPTRLAGDGARTLRPLIAPARHFVYPREVEEVERGAFTYDRPPLSGSWKRRRIPSPPLLSASPIPAVPTGLLVLPQSTMALCRRRRIRISGEHRQSGNNGK